MPELPLETLSEPPSEPLVEVGHYQTSAKASEHGLVVLAMGVPYWLVPADEGYRLFVAAAIADSAREQLARFDRESTRWPPRELRPREPSRPFELVTPLFWAVVVLGIFIKQAAWPNWVERGVLDADRLFRHAEVWRPATALFIHGTREHVISNALSGILVFSAVLTTLGRSRGWLLLALAAFLGNVAAAAAHYPGEYHSVGASTAIFAGVGLLTGRALRLVQHAHHPHRWRAAFVALTAGLTILGLYGAGGMQIDVLAHFTGFLAGMALGYFEGRRSHPGRATDESERNFITGNE